MQDQLTVYCRHIRKEDLRKIMKWRMQPDITRFMNTDPHLTLKDQEKWFSSICDNEPFLYWIITLNNQDVGVIQIVDYTADVCEWGYYVSVKSARSLSLAISLELSLYEYMFSNTPVDTIIAQTFSINTSVVRLHELCGCETKEILKDHVHKNGESFDVTVQYITRTKWETNKNKLSYQHIDFEN